MRTIGFRLKGSGFGASKQGIGRGSASFQRAQYQLITALFPVFGFGQFQYPFISLSGGRAVINYYDTWPSVYTKQVVTYTQSDGASLTQTTTFNPVLDHLGTAFRTIDTSSSGSVNIYEINGSITTGGSYLSFSYWADAAHTISGTFEVQMSGTILDTSAAGPFDPNDPTHGWGELASKCDDLLAFADFYSATSGYTHRIVIPTPSSPYYEVISDPSLWEISPTSIQPPPLIVPAAARAFPLRNWSIDGSPISFISTVLLNSCQFAKCIVDYPNFDDFASHYFDPSSGYTYGFCCSLKSVWVVNGLPPDFGADSSYSGLNPWPNSNDHRSFYAQPLILGSSSGSFFGGFSVPAATLADTSGWITGGANPVGVGSSIAFLPSYVKASTESIDPTYHFGLLGFWNTNF